MTRRGSIPDDPQIFGMAGRLLAGEKSAVSPLRFLD